MFLVGEMSVCLHVSSADHASSFWWLSSVCQYPGLAVCVRVCMCVMYQWLSVCVCVSMHVHVSRAERLCACACTYRELREYVHVSAHIWGSHVSARIEG
jgi:hypothetical protein